jgi:L-arabinose isomerase
MKQLVQEYDLGAITIDCYPRYMGRTCVGFSLLADDGITCACEADVHVAILAWIIQRLSGKPTNHIDTLDVDIAQNTVVGGHCGACSLQLASPGTAIVGPVRLSNDGACVMFPCRGGPVTMVNLVGRTGSFRAWIITGMAIETKLVFPGNPIMIKLDLPVSEFLSIADKKGFGHHWLVGYGTSYVPVLLKLFMLYWSIDVCENGHL